MKLKVSPTMFAFVILFMFVLCAILGALLHNPQAQALGESGAGWSVAAIVILAMLS